MQNISAANVKLNNTSDRNVECDFDIVKQIQKASMLQAIGVRVHNVSASANGFIWNSTYCR
jgi:hypothetical protein